MLTHQQIAKSVSHWMLQKLKRVVICETCVECETILDKTSFFFPTTLFSI
jgi:hypothetical protein